MNKISKLSIVKKKNKIKILFFTILISLCSVSWIQEEQQIKGNNFLINEPDTFQFDTFVILLNKNLDYLIKCLENGGLKESKNIDDIPFFIRDALNNWTDDNFSIANPNEEWQSTDIIFDTTLPNRNLLYMGIGENIFLISYYLGGNIGTSRHILIIKHENEKITDFWCGSSLESLDKKLEILEYIRNNKDKPWGLNTNMIYF